MKKFVSIILLATILLSGIPLAKAKDNSKTVIMLEDGNRIVITLEEEITTLFSGSRALKTKTGRKTCDYINAQGVLEWRAVLTATFTYNGVNAKCIEAECPVSVAKVDWTLKLKTIKTDGAAASVDLTMYHSGQNKSVSYYLTLSCDKDGKLT